MRGKATVWLVGMMGAGKTAVGRALATRLELPFVDSDAEVERAAGASVREIFASEDEAGFRARERATVEKLAGTPAVVALGGGAPAQPGMLLLLERTGTVVWLRARVETLLARVGDAAERPLLEGLAADARRERIAALLAERTPLYARAALTLDTDALTPEAVARRLAADLGRERR